MCDFHDSFFGATYPDACCIEGYLWDEDSGDGDGLLYSGGDEPCPKCNTEAYLLRAKERAESGYSHPEGAGVEWEADIAFCRHWNADETDRVLREAIKQIDCCVPHPTDPGDCARKRYCYS